MNILEKIKEHKSDLPVLGGLLIIFVILSSIFMFRQGSILIDCFGQNAYIPMEMLKGKVLYKDITVPYGPLSYQLNAMLMLIFGISLNTVYFAGVINSLAILLMIYLISRNITGKKISFIVTFLVMTVCVFHFWITNYIFPYSSAMTYSLSTFLASVLCSIHYLKKSKPAYILWAFIFITVSVLIKLDFLLFVPILIAILFIKPVSKKYLVLTFITSSIVPLLSWIVLFIQGVTLSDLYNTLANIRKFSQSEAFRQFYTNYTGMFYNTKLLNIDFVMFKTVFVNLSIAAVIIYLYCLILQKIFNLLKITLNNFVLFLFSIPLFLFFLKQYYIHLFTRVTFSWTPVMATAIFIIVLIYLFVNIKFFESLTDNSKYKAMLDKFKLISLKQWIFILVCIAAIISAMRCYYFINLQVFGTFVLPLVLLVNIVFWGDYLPSFVGKYIKFFNVEIWKKSWVICLAFLGIVFLINNMLIVTKNDYPLKTPKGTYYLRSQPGQVIQQAVSYINENSDKNDTLLVIPRGLSINFFTGLSSNNRYYDFIPPTIEVTGEDKIVQNLKHNKPRYILVTNEDLSEWGAPFICRDYAFNICKFIQDNYKYKAII